MLNYSDFIYFILQYHKFRQHVKCNVFLNTELENETELLTWQKTTCLIFCRCRDQWESASDSKVLVGRLHTWSPWSSQTLGPINIQQYTCIYLAFWETHKQTKQTGHFIQDFFLYCNWYVCIFFQTLLPRTFHCLLICLSLTRSSIFFQGCLSKLMGYSSLRLTAST